MKTLVYRSFKICSNWCLFHDEVIKMRMYLEKNSYPKSFIDIEIEKYLNNSKVNQ